MTNHTYAAPTQFGYNLIRNHVLPSILGKHEGDILYWAGKEIARKFPLLSVEEIPVFFQEAGWGQLTLDKMSKREAFYKLESLGESLHTDERNFQLEAGFIAEQFQKINGVLTECYAEKKAKNQTVTFQIAWDKKEVID